MRTKSMILGAALLAAGVASSMAQSNVYSLNVVGYVNISLTNGFTCFANPLDADGTGTNNTIQGVFGTSLPNNSIVYKFSAGTFGTFYTFARGGWSGNASLNPGEAVMVTCPSATNITVVGQVLQGTLTNQTISTGFSLVSGLIPVQNTIDSTGNGGLQYVPSNNDIVYFWDPVGQSWANFFTYARGGWSTDPVITPGVGFFLSTQNPTPSWTTSFTVQ